MGTTKEQAQQLIKKDSEEWLVEDEQPQHTVELSEYSIGKYPITNKEYQAFVKDAERTPPFGWRGDQFPVEKAERPVVNVDWYDAVAYCRWLSEKTNKPYRLPTEAEWEKAARGTDGREWPWGNEFNLALCNSAEGGLGTTPVGAYSPQGDSPYGCADMAGNVWEWCNDWYNADEYKQRQKAIMIDPSGPEEKDAPLYAPFYLQGRRVMRGGSFFMSGVDTRCANRSSFYPDRYNDSGGFRVASSPIKVESGD